MSEAVNFDIAFPSSYGRHGSTSSLREHDGEEKLTVPVQETQKSQQSNSGREVGSDCTSRDYGYTTATWTPSSIMPPHSSQRRGVIECDAALNRRERDAPGQSCIYIPSGDHRQEMYRLATYSRYPDNVPVKPGDLAAAGLYYTGFKDRVKCFSCGMAVENWILGDDEMDKQWHHSLCPLMSGTEYDNVSLPGPSFRTLFRAYKGLNSPFISGLPIESSDQATPSGSSRDLSDVTTNMSQVRLSDTYPKLILANIVVPEHERKLRRVNLKSELERRNTFEKWPSYPAPYLVNELAKEGFFYLGNLDRTQCFSCSGVLRNWAPSDGVREQHQKHFPNCRVILGLDTGNLPMSDAARREADREYQQRMTQLNSSSGEPPDPSPEEKIRLAVVFPCLNAINPHMVSLNRRLETFDHRWPTSRIRATVQQIARAGFFFLGESDKTKCYYCNGGLQNWDPNDEPWTEHAKWFPGCEFVLRNKGIEFVRRLAEAHPNLNRPYIRNPVSYRDIPPSEVQRSTPVESMETQTTANPLANIDINHVTNDMGFRRIVIDEAVARRTNEGGNFGSTEELVQYMLDHGEELTAAYGEQDSTATPALPEQTTTVPVLCASASGGISQGHKREGEKERNILTKKTRTSSPTHEDMQKAEILRKKTEASKCLNCKTKKREVVFNPCGHLSVCGSCAPALTRCTICNSKIQDTIRVYMA